MWAGWLLWHASPWGLSLHLCQCQAAGSYVHAVLLLPAPWLECRHSFHLVKKLHQGQEPGSCIRTAATFLCQSWEVGVGKSSSSFFLPGPAQVPVGWKLHSCCSQGEGRGRWKKQWHQGHSWKLPGSSTSPCCLVLVQVWMAAKPMWFHGLDPAHKP